jgi:hypothetical protein
MARAGILTNDDHQNFTSWLSEQLVGLKTGKFSVDDVQGSLGQVVGAVDVGEIGEVRNWIEGRNADRSGPTSMKSPAEVVPPLSDEQGRQVSHLVEQIQEWLASHSEYLVQNIYGLKPFLSEDVWQEVVAVARKQGWDANMQGSQVSIKRPQR